MTVPSAPIRSRLVLERPATAFVDLAEPVSALVSALDAEHRTDTVWVVGEPPGSAVSPTPEGLHPYLESVDSARSAGHPDICRLARGDGSAELFLEVEPTESGGIGVVWMPLLDGSPEAPEAVAHVTGDAAVAFGAGYGRVEDADLLLRYHGQRAHQRAVEVTPPELREYLPAPDDVAPELELPHLLVPQEYDRLRVPPAVWWINVWGPGHLSTLGVDRVRAAPWSRIEGLPEGRLLLVATPRPPSPSDPDDVAALRHIVEALGLRAAQEALLTARRPRQ